LNPGSPTPQAGILDQYSRPTPNIPPIGLVAEAIRRPLEGIRYAEQIQKTIEKATIEGKAANTIHSFKCRLVQLNKAADLMNPDDVKKSIGYAKLANTSKCSFALAYNWFCKANGLTWEKPRFKWNLNAPIIPTTSQVEKIISATTRRFATIFKLMSEIGIEGEELHQTHRNQIDLSQAIFNVKGLKGHGRANYKLKTATNEMIREYLAKNPTDYPFPRPKTMSKMWRTARYTASRNNNDPALLKIPMKNLRNYSGAQFYYAFPDPIGVMRHLRHKRMETTMHYLRALTLDGDAEFDCKTATNAQEIAALIEKGYVKADEIDGIHFYKKRK